MRRNFSEIITRMSTIAILSALGTVIMLFIKIPYVFAPWLEIEFSDTIILVAYALYGLPGALATAIIKTLFSFIFQGVGFLGIGQISAFIASVSYILGIYICSHVLKWFRRGFLYRILSYVIIAVIVSLIMTLLNILFITPTYMAGQWATCFNSDIVNSIVNTYPDYGSNFIMIMVFLYVPFNLMKALIVELVYELVFNRLIFVIFKDNAFVQKYFIGCITKKKTCDIASYSSNDQKKKSRRKKVESGKVYKDRCELNDLVQACKNDDQKKDEQKK